MGVGLDLPFDDVIDDAAEIAVIEDIPKFIEQFLKE